MITTKWCKVCGHIRPISDFYEQKYRDRHGVFKYTGFSTLCRDHHNRQSQMLQSIRDPKRERDKVARQRRREAHRLQHLEEKKQLRQEMIWAIGRIRHCTGYGWDDIAKMVGCHPSTLWSWRTSRSYPKKTAVERAVDVCWQIIGMTERGGHQEEDVVA